VEVRHIDPNDDTALAEWAAVLQASDKELWPDLTGYELADIRAFARYKGSARHWELLAAGEKGGPMLGVGMLEFPTRDNLHAAEIVLAVHPQHRRRGVGTAIVERMAEVARSDGRRTLNVIVDVPVDAAAEHPSVYFGPRVGFEPTLPGNSRHLRLPLDGQRLEELRAMVSDARDAAAYRMLTFETPWPSEFVRDHCALLEVMSTDEPAGDGEREAEEWDEERLREGDELLAARGAAKVAAVAQHVESGRLVAMTEILIADDVPEQAWQMITVVHPDHRGHRLGLAVKLANLELLAERAPKVELVVTGNASVNAPMIAVNDMMGFEIAGQGTFWQKHLSPP
jgi:GNAT superfamily N-acetyltransferase